MGEHRSKARIVASFCGSLAFSLLMLHGGGAQAGWERVASGVCSMDFGRMTHVNGGGNVYNSASSRGYAFCPITDTAIRPKQSISTLNVHVNDRSNDNDVLAAACITYWNAVGGECGVSSASGTSNMGIVALAPSRSKWSSANSAHFGYLEVSLPAQQTNGNGPSSFFGYFTDAP